MLPPHQQRWLSRSLYPEAETQVPNLPKTWSLYCCLPGDIAAAAEGAAVGDDDTVAASVAVGSVAVLVGADVDLVFVAAGAVVEPYCSTECNCYFPVLNYSPHPEEMEGDAYSSCWEDCLKHLKFQAKTWQYFDSAAAAAVVVAAFEMEQAHTNAVQIAADHCLAAAVAAESCALEAAAEPGNAEGPEDAVAASETASRVADDAAAAVDSKT